MQGAEGVRRQLRAPLLDLAEKPVPPHRVEHQIPGPEIRKRLRVFYDQTAPVISYYEGKHKFVRLPSARHGRSLLEELETAVGGTE